MAGVIRRWPNSRPAPAAVRCSRRRDWLTVAGGRRVDRSFAALLLGENGDGGGNARLVDRRPTGPAPQNEELVRRQRGAAAASDVALPAATFAVTSAPVSSKVSIAPIPVTSAHARKLTVVAMNPAGTRSASERNPASHTRRGHPVRSNCPNCYNARGDAQRERQISYVSSHARCSVQLVPTVDHAP